MVCHQTKEEVGPLHSHHWVIHAGRCLRTRFLVDNGVCLCFTDHMRKIHDEADAITYDIMRGYMMAKIGRARYEEIKEIRRAVAGDPRPVSMAELREWRDAFLERKRQREAGDAEVV